MVRYEGGWREYDDWMPGLGEKEGVRGGKIVQDFVVHDEQEEEGDEEVRAPVRKKRRVVRNVQSLLEAVIARQQMFFSDLLESIERKEQIREQIRHEREDKWRAEERAQLGVFNNALIALTRELVGDGVADNLHGMTGLLLGGNNHCPSSQRPKGHKKSRFKNWRRSEVVQLIKLRGEMDSKFEMIDVRAAMWDELGERLSSKGFRRNGKQCCEKWDKLLTMYREVAEGKRKIDETPYFSELTNVLKSCVNV